MRGSLWRTGLLSVSPQSDIPRFRFFMEFALQGDREDA